MSKTWINMSPLAKTYTLEEFWQLPEPPDGSKIELIAGVLFMTPPPEYTHDNIVSRVNRLLTRHLLATNASGRIHVPRAALWTGPNTYIEPDLFYISAELEARLDPKHRNTADLVVEVVSPSSFVYDHTTKADTYGVLGVRELWLIDEKSQTVTVRTQQGNGFGQEQVFQTGEQLVSTVFPTLSVSVDKLFED